MKVLDVGCGIGGPAREMAKLVGCEVVGITINQAQVDRAIQLTAQEGLTGKCTFLKADWHVRFYLYHRNAPFPLPASAELSPSIYICLSLFISLPDRSGLKPESDLQKQSPARHDLLCGAQHFTSLPSASTQHALHY
jgi:SAM-dependent methyltransferase